MMDSMGDGGSTATTLLMLLVWLLTLAAAFAGGWLVAHRGLPARLVEGLEPIAPPMAAMSSHRFSMPSMLMAALLTVRSLDGAEPTKARRIG